MAVASDEPIERLYQPIHDRKPPEGGDGSEPRDGGRHLQHGFAAGYRGTIRPEYMKGPGQLTWPRPTGRVVAWLQVLERDQGQATARIKLPEPPGR